jgi:hypothetical protein
MGQPATQRKSVPITPAPAATTSVNSMVTQPGISDAAPAATAPSAATTSPVAKNPFGSAPNPEMNVNTSATAAAATANTALANAKVAAQRASDYASFDAMVGNLQGNPLNTAYLPTYHFRLFLVGDKIDILDQARATSASTLAQAILGLPQVTIAESGVTGFSFREVKLTSTAAGVSDTRHQTQTSAEITLVDPLGVTLFDAFVAAATTLQVSDWTKAPYYLALNFLGYDSTGTKVSLASDLTNGGFWLWSLTIGQVETKISETGGVFTIHATIVDAVAITEPTNDTNRTAGQRPITCSGQQLGTLWSDYAAKMNAARGETDGRDKRTGKPLITIIIKSVPLIRGGVTIDPANFSLPPKEPEKNTQRNLAFSADQPYTVTVKPETSIEDFLTESIKQTADGQTLAKDEPTQAMKNAGPTDVNTKMFRESIQWSVEVDVRITGFDATGTSRQYFKEVTYYVKPRYDQNVPLSTTQVDNARMPTTQKAMIQSLLSNGFLNRRYEWLFTGLNTEVIDFKCDVNFSFTAIAPSAGGAHQSIDAIQTNARFNTNNYHPNADQGQVARAGDSTNPVTSADAAVPAVTAPQSPVGPSQTATPPVTSAPTTEVIGAGGANIYVEDLLGRQNQATGGNANFTVPTAFWQRTEVAKIESGNDGFPGQYYRDKSVLGAIFAGIGTDASQVTTEFNKIDLTIRGDPYWLGQSNLQRKLALRNNNSTSPAPNVLPDWTSGAQGIFLHFRFPQQVGDDFKPVLKNSAVFSGLYQVNTVDSTFVDGTFQQILHCSRMNMHDPDRISNDSSLINGGAGSSPQTADTTPTTPPTLQNLHSTPATH